MACATSDEEGRPLLPTDRGAPPEPVPQPPPQPTGTFLAAAVALGCLAAVAFVRQAALRGDAEASSEQGGVLQQGAASTSPRAPLRAVLDAGSDPPLGVAELNVLQWNPHWRCFVLSDSCTKSVEASLDHTLSAHSIDFASVIELEDSQYRPPAGFKILKSTCGLDTAALLYDSRRWIAHQPAVVGCMVPKDRPFIVQLFKHVAGPGQLVVAGAHYPHRTDRKAVEALGRAISSVRKASGVRRVLLAADLNREASWPSAKVMRRLAVPGADESHSSELLRTCCLNDGFSHAYDRVIANFGASVQSQLLNDPAPSWAIGEFHKGIAARLKLEG